MIDAEYMLIDIIIDVQNVIDVQNGIGEQIALQFYFFKKTK